MHERPCCREQQLLRQDTIDGPWQYGKDDVLRSRLRVVHLFFW